MDYFGVIVSSIAETLELHGRRLVLDAGEAVQRIPALPALAGRADVYGAVLILPPEDRADVVASKDAATRSSSCGDATGSCTGVVSVDGCTVTRNAEYHTLGHLGKCVRPGAVRVGTQTFGVSCNGMFVSYTLPPNGSRRSPGRRAAAPPSTSGNQLWQFRPTSNGHYRVVDRNAATLVRDVSTVSTTDGVHVGGAARMMGALSVRRWRS